MPETSLLTLEKTLTPADDRRTLRFAFEVPVPLQRLTVTLSYEPALLTDPDKARPIILKALEKYGYPVENWQGYLPLQNFVTVSLDDPQRCRGNAHRKTNPITLMLSEDEASPGLIAGDLPIGTWSLTLHVHALVSEQVDLFCQVKGVKA